LSLIVLLVFFSLGGIPPLTGFLSKAFILIEIVFSSQVIPAILILIISSFSMFYYLRVLKITFFEPQLSSRALGFYVVFNSKVVSTVYLVVSGLLTILLLIFIFPNEIYFLSLYVLLTSSLF
jgi:NADH-quinone oxidoreductase subunit N